MEILCTHFWLFNFSDVQTGSYRGLGVKYLSFESTLDNLSNIKVKLYHVTKDGVIINGDETINIVQGMKLALEHLLHERTDIVFAIDKRRVLCYGRFTINTCLSYIASFSILFIYKLRRKSLVSIYVFS